MATEHPVGAPAPLSGTEGLTARTEARLIWWTLRARLYGPGTWWLVAATIATATVPTWVARPLGPWTALMFGAAAAALFLVGIVVFVAAVQLIANARRRRRGWLIGYFTNDATQLVYPDSLARWVLSDHLARRRRRGLATVFRCRVFAHVAYEADRHHAVIVMATHSEKLAVIYTQNMPSLGVVAYRRTIYGRTWTLQRDPHLGS